MERESFLYKVRRKCQVLAHKVVSNEALSKLYFKIVLHKKLNLKDPQTFNEKIQWMKLYYYPKNSLVVNCSDKYKVRKYIDSIAETTDFKFEDFKTRAYSVQEHFHINRLDPKTEADLDKNLQKRISDGFFFTQFAHLEFDYDKMRTLLSDELYNNYRVQLKTLSTKGQKNVMKDIEFVRGSIKHFEITESSINITVELAVRQNDYIVDEDGNIIKGDKIKDRNTYELLVTRAISPNVRNNCCPNCGAAIGDSASQTCEYCGASLITLSKDFVIAKKRILVQR